jgi:uncharacterized protein (DUF2062 family)
MADEAEKPGNGEVPQNGYTVWERFHRLLRYRLVVPILRTRHEPEYTARGVLAGVVIGLTPTVGVQMPIVLGVWAIVKGAIPGWNFSLIAALAWVWLSNVFTIVPLYFGFLVTGRLLMGDFDAVPGYETFSRELMAALHVKAHGADGFWAQTRNLFELYGLPMLIGCLPWAVLGGWGGYAWTLTFLRRRRRRAEEKRRASGEA